MKSILVPLSLFLVGACASSSSSSGTTDTTTGAATAAMPASSGPPTPLPSTPPQGEPVMAAPPAGSAGPAAPGSSSAGWTATPPAAPAGGAAPASAGKPVPASRRSEYSGPDPCKLAISGNSPVDRACSEGGLKAAKATMKDLVKKGKAVGVAFDCDDCHSDPEDYSRVHADASEKFKRLIAAAR